MLFSSESLESRVSLSRSMGANWASFARGDVPTSEGDAVWEPYGSDANLLYFDTAADGGIRLEPGADTVDQLFADLQAESRVDQASKCLIAEGLLNVLGDERPTGVDDLGCDLG